MENLIETPTTIRGVDCTEKEEETIENKGFINDSEQFIIIDWFQFTFLESNYNFDLCSGEFMRQHVDDIVVKLFYELFHIERNELLREESRLNGYEYKYSYRDIEAYFSYSRPDMGINFKLTGKGCRDAEEKNVDWCMLVYQLKSYQINYNRIDIAIDDFTDRYFTLKKIQKCIRENRVVTKFYHALSMTGYSMKECKIDGNQVQFGSKASMVEITFYDKLLERKSANVIVNNHIEYWTRCELRFRHERAEEVSKLISDSQDLNKSIKGILLDYIRFVDRDSKDSNKRRWKTSKFWTDYLENVERLKLSSIAPERTITKSTSWLMKSVSKTQLMVLLSKLDNLTTDECSIELFKEMLTKDKGELTSKQLEMINDYRRSNHLVELTKQQIYDYVRDIKDVIICIKQEKNT